MLVDIEKSLECFDNSGHFECPNVVDEATVIKVGHWGEKYGSDQSVILHYPFSSVRITLHRDQHFGDIKQFSVFPLLERLSKTDLGTKYYYFDINKSTYSLYPYMYGGVSDFDDIRRNIESGLLEMAKECNKVMVNRYNHHDIPTYFLQAFKRGDVDVLQNFFKDQAFVAETDGISPHHHLHKIEKSFIKHVPKSKEFVPVKSQSPKNPFVKFIFTNDLVSGNSDNIELSGYELGNIWSSKFR